jgi:hypothetical protein
MGFGDDGRLPRRWSRIMALMPIEQRRSASMSLGSQVLQCGYSPSPYEPSAPRVYQPAALP